MPIESDINKSRQFLTISSFGKILPNEIAYATESNFREQQISKFLFDIRFCVIETNLLLDELDRVFNTIQTFNFKSLIYFKVAIVASTELWFKIAKRLIFIPQTKKHQHKIFVFRFKDEAIEWLFLNQ